MRSPSFSNLNDILLTCNNYILIKKIKICHKRLQNKNSIKDIINFFVSSEWWILVITNNLKSRTQSKKNSLFSDKKKYKLCIKILHGIKLKDAGIELLHELNILECLFHSLVFIWLIWSFLRYSIDLKNKKNTNKKRNESEISAEKVPLKY